VAPFATSVGREVAGQPLIGHLVAFRRHRLDLLDACITAPDDVIELRIRTPAYLLKRAEDIRHVLVDGQGVYAKDQRNIGSRATRIFGDGLMTSNGDRHRRMRRQVQPVFRRRSMAPLSDVAVRGVDAMVDRWPRDGEINLADEMARFALQTLTGSIFGVEEGPEFAALQDGVAARRHSMTRALSALTPLPAFLPMALRPRRRRAIRQLEEAIDQLIAATREEAIPRSDLLSLVMHTHDPQLFPPDPGYVYDQTLTFALAAYENVARALTWTLLALARHPPIEARLRTEVDCVLGGRAPEEADRHELRYTEMVLAEALRLWPPNALLSRVAQRDDVLPTGSRVRAGSKLLLSPYVVHRDPTYYPDPERFDPERFSEEGRRGRPRYAYFPFGGGPRVCVGRMLAVQQCTLALARIHQLVRLELAGEPARYVCGCLPAGFGPSMRVTLMDTRTGPAGDRHPLYAAD
jgi:cytochrome P450